MPCLRQAEANVGWRGARRVKPGFLYHDSRRTSKVKREGKEVKLGSRLGVQSKPNPKLSATPPLRPARDGSRWCYDVVTGDAGHVDEACFVIDDSVTLARRGEFYCGPADVDFQITPQNPNVAARPRGHDPKKAEPRPKAKSGAYVIKVGDTKVRLAPHGSGFEWTGRGDEWECEGLVDMGDELDYCMRCTKSVTGWCPVGTRGYIIGPSIKRLH